MGVAQWSGNQRNKPIHCCQTTDTIIFCVFFLLLFFAFNFYHIPRPHSFSAVFSLADAESWFLCTCLVVVLNKIKLIEWLGVCRKSLLINKRQRALCALHLQNDSKIVRACNLYLCDAMLVLWHHTKTGKSIRIWNFYDDLRNLEIRYYFCSDCLGIHQKTIFTCALFLLQLEFVCVAWDSVASRKKSENCFRPRTSNFEV